MYKDRIFSVWKSRCVINPNAFASQLKVPVNWTLNPPTDDLDGTSSIVTVLNGYNSLISDTFNGVSQIKYDISSLTGYIDPWRQRHCSQQQPKPEVPGPLQELQSHKEFIHTVGIEALMRVKEFLNRLLKNLDQLETCWRMYIRTSISKLSPWLLDNICKVSISDAWLNILSCPRWKLDNVLNWNYYWTGTYLYTLCIYLYMVIRRYVFCKIMGFFYHSNTNVSGEILNDTKVNQLFTRFVLWHCCCVNKELWVKNVFPIKPVIKLTQQCSIKTGGYVILGNSWQPSWNLPRKPHDVCMRAGRIGEEKLYFSAISHLPKMSIYIHGWHVILLCSWHYFCCNKISIHFLTNWFLVLCEVLSLLSSGFKMKSE